MMNSGKAVGQLPVENWVRATVRGVLSRAPFNTCGEVLDEDE